MKCGHEWGEGDMTAHADVLQRSDSVYIEHVCQDQFTSTNGL